jgi:hypothetical protein
VDEFISERPKRYYGAVLSFNFDFTDLINSVSFMEKFKGIRNSYDYLHIQEHAAEFIGMVLIDQFLASQNNELGDFSQMIKIQASKKRSDFFSIDEKNPNLINKREKVYTLSEFKSRLPFKNTKEKQDRFASAYSNLTAAESQIQERKIKGITVTNGYIFSLEYHTPDEKNRTYNMIVEILSPAKPKVS